MLYNVLVGTEILLLWMRLSACVKGRSRRGTSWLSRFDGFGRRAMAVNPAEAKAYMIYQLGALQAFCDSHDLILQHMQVTRCLFTIQLVLRL